MPCTSPGDGTLSDKADVDRAKRAPRAIPTPIDTVAPSIPLRAAVAWRLLIDTNEWRRWGPIVRAVDAPERRVGLGMHGRVHALGGIWLPFEITG